MRPLWFLAGAGAGVYVMVRARRAAEALTPEGLADRVDGLRLGWQLFSDEVRAGMTEKESELRERMLLSSHEGPRALPPGAPTHPASLDRGPARAEELPDHAEQ